MSLLEQFNGWRENNRLEFKRAVGGFPKSFWETYSAFANTEGGVIVLGVEETPAGPRAVGVPDAARLVQDLWNGLNSPQKVSVNLLVDSDVSIEDADGAKLVVVKVPRADRFQRPVFINNSMNAGTFRRNGEGDYHCTMEAVSAMVRDNAEAAIDKEPLDDVGLDALCRDSINRYRNEFSVMRANHPWAALPEEEFLLRLGAIGRSQRDGALHPTKAGLLMFGEAWRITDAFPNYFLDCRQISGARRWDNRITSDSGDWSGNVYDFWNKAYLMLCEGLPRPFALGANMARMDDTPQHKALREGLTNALVHADYCGRTGIVAIRRADTVEFSNPGCLRLPPEVVEGGGVSDPRNKTLMTMFNLIGKGDKAGSGFDVFRRAAEYAGVPGPQLEEALEPDRTRLTLHVQADGAKLAADDELAGGVVSGDGLHGGNGGLKTDNVGIYGGINASDDVDGGLKVESGGLNGANGGLRPSSKEEKEIAPIEAGEFIAQLVRERPDITVAQMAAALGVSKRKAERLVAALQSQGRLARIGSRKTGHWEVLD